MILKDFTISETVIFYENGVLKYSVTTSSYTFASLNTIQSGIFYSPESTFKMYKASIEVYMKAMTGSEVLDSYARSLNNTFLHDTC